MSRIYLSQDGVFETIQGEGSTVGRLSTFVRLQGCNLDCYFCDTAYTWDGTEKSVKKFVSGVSDEMLSHNARNFVITGGEPLLQMGGVEELVSLLVGAGGTVEIETNGTILPSDYLCDNCTINCSPKKGYINDYIIRYLSTYSKNIFKFVTDGDDVVDYIPRYLDRDKVWLMPMTNGSVDYNQCFILCMKYGYHLSPRMQVELFGDKRNV